MDTTAHHSHTLLRDARALWRVACAAVLALRPLRAAPSAADTDPADCGTAFGLDAVTELQPGDTPPRGALTRQRPLGR
jgi:hypothetical protein